MKPSLAIMALLLAGCATRPAPEPVASVPPAAVPPTFQYLYGSGEGGALQMAMFHALIAYVHDRVEHRPADSVVVAQGSPMVGAKFVPCGDKPLAVVFDVDETLTLNLGIEAREAAGEKTDPAVLDRWEQTGGSAVAPAPGALHTLDELRELGVTAVFNSNRSAANADYTAAMLEKLGMGPVRHLDNLWLKGDVASGGGKDPRRWKVAERYCVIAMAGDQLGDFSDLFNQPMSVSARRQLAVHSSAGGLWGKGWFILPNTVYGTALKGGFDDVFPADKRWSDPQGDK
jgi:5'-nucleotidase (lipoprotein e(P4) family)